MPPILAFGNVRDNAQRMVDCRELGYLDDSWPILDPTYRYGKFWTLWMPTNLVATDIVPQFSPSIPEGVDFRHMPWDDCTFGAVVLDGPYKLNGTSTGEGPSKADILYGVEGEYRTVRQKHDLIMHGMSASWRVLDHEGFLLVKCQDQVNASQKRWQSRIFADHGDKLGGRLVDMLYVEGYRPQPGKQKHARQDFSTLLVIQKPKARR